MANLYKIKNTPLSQVFASSAISNTNASTVNEYGLTFGVANNITTNNQTYSGPVGTFSYITGYNKGIVGGFYGYTLCGYNRLGGDIGTNGNWCSYYVDYTSSATPSIPSGCVGLYSILIGGGGSGGSALVNVNGSGGSAGELIYSIINNLGGANNFSVIIGNGGLGQNSLSSQGNPGNATQLILNNSIVASARGGIAGNAGVGNNSNATPPLYYAIANAGSWVINSTVQTIQSGFFALRPGGNQVGLTPGEYPVSGGNIAYIPPYVWLSDCYNTATTNAIYGIDGYNTKFGCGSDAGKAINYQSNLPHTQFSQNANAGFARIFYIFHT